MNDDDDINTFDISEYSDVKTLVFKGKVIWSEAINGNDTIPEYVYEYERSCSVRSDILDFHITVERYNTIIPARLFLTDLQEKLIMKRERN